MKTPTLCGAVLAGMCIFLPALVQAQLTYFPIATSGVAISSACDGSNYLVGIEFPATGNISAQLLSSSGAKIGSPIATGRTGLGATVAFDGTNYLMIWEDDALGTLTGESYQVYGQFIGKTGTTNGAPFNISGLGIQYDGIKSMAYGGGKYLVTYTRISGSVRYIAGRIVNPNGTMGSEIRISTGSGKASDVAFDGTNFFVVWCDDNNDSEIRGRFVSTGGVPGSEISVNASAAPSDNPNSVAFDGTNYMVVWNDEVGGFESGEWNCFGQRISTSGTLVGSTITLTSEPGQQMVATLAFDGSNYMAVWMDMQDETNWDMYGQYIGAGGSLVGGKLAISTAAGNQLGGVGFANGKFLVLVNNGVEMGEGGVSQSDSATGAFIVPSSTPATLYYTDDFNDNAKDPAKWGSDILVDQGTNATLTETNGRLEFRGGSSADDSVAIIRPWIGSFGSYTQNWEAAADIHVGSVALPQNADISMFLAVVENGDPALADHFSVDLSMRNDYESSIQRNYDVNAAYNNNEADLGRSTTADQQGRLRLAFDASTKILTGSFNGNALGSMDVDAATTSWGMNNSSSFLVVLGGSLWGDGATNSGHEVYADNFELRTGNQLPYLLTVNSGSGSGNYTNGLGISITADAAPAGRVFDHWVGSTQYLANAGSATTTVTMPPQAISVTAAYKLIGTGLGDDFNDNSTDSAKWANDLHFADMNSSLLEVNGRLEFRKTAGVDAQGVLRPWIGSVGSYTQSWEVAVDAYLGNLALPSNESWINMNLIVANQSDVNLLNGDSLSIALDLYRSDNKLHRGFEMTSHVDGYKLPNVPNYGYASTADLQGRLKIAFDAATKVLTASYNSTVLGWVDVDAPGSDWGMADGDFFGFGLVGSPGSTALGVSSGQAYFDNFAATGSVAAPADWDGNALPDWWEQFYFSATGVDPNVLCANGINTIKQAYIAGFSPVDPNAGFGITGFSGNTIQWSAVSNRIYSIYWTTNLLAGFQVLEPNWTGGSFTDSLHGAEKKGFYKIDVRLAP